MVKEVKQLVDLLLFGLLCLLGCLCPRRLLFLFEIWLDLLSRRLFDFGSQRLTQCILLFLSHLVPLLLDLFESLRCFFLLLLLLFFLHSQIFLELLEPFFMIIEDGEHSLFGFMLVVLLDGDETDLFVGEDSGAELPG